MTQLEKIATELIGQDEAKRLEAVRKAELALKRDLDMHLQHFEEIFRDYLPVLKEAGITYKASKPSVREKRQDITIVLTKKGSPFYHEIEVRGDKRWLPSPGHAFGWWEPERYLILPLYKNFFQPNK